VKRLRGALGASESSRETWQRQAARAQERATSLEKESEELRAALSASEVPLLGGDTEVLQQLVALREEFDQCKAREGASRAEFEILLQRESQNRIAAEAETRRAREEVDRTRGEASAERMSSERAIASVSVAERDARSESDREAFFFQERYRGSQEEVAELQNLLIITIYGHHS